MRHIPISLMIAVAATTAFSQEPVTDFSSGQSQIITRIDTLEKDCYHGSTLPDDPSRVKACADLESQLLLLEKAGLCPSYVEGEPASTYYRCTEQRGFARNIEVNGFPYGIHIDSISADFLATLEELRYTRDGLIRKPAGQIFIECRADGTRTLIFELPTENPHFGELVEITTSSDSGGYDDANTGIVVRDAGIMKIFSSNKDLITNLLLQLYYGIETTEMVRVEIRGDRPMTNAIILLKFGHVPFDEIILLKTQVASFHQLCKN